MILQQRAIASPNDNYRFFCNEVAMYFVMQEQDLESRLIAQKYYNINKSKHTGLS
jgi:hypothetical protein